MDNDKTKKENNKIIFLIAILIIGGVVVYMLFFKDKKDGGNNHGSNVLEGQNDKLDSNKELYQIIDGDEFTINDSITNEKITISFDYPKINIDTEDVKNINDIIYSLYQRKQKEFLDNKSNLIEQNGIYHCDGTCDFNYLKYNISDTDNYLAITIRKMHYCHCGDGPSVIGYVIDKKSKEVLSNEDILALFNVDEKLFIEYYRSKLCPSDNNLIESIHEINLFIEDKKIMFTADSCANIDVYKYEK